MSALAAIVAFLKAIPALAKFGEWLGETLKEYDRKRNEAEAARRKADKLDRIDDRLREYDRLHPYETRPHRKTDAEK